MNKIKIKKNIEQNVYGLLKHPLFQDWFGSQTIHKDDILLINNSFIFRKDVITNKSRLYVALNVKELERRKPTIFIAEWDSFNSEFKLFSRNFRVPSLTSLDKAIDDQIVTLGEMVFILIGYVEDNVQIKVPVGYGPYKTLMLDPALTEQVNIQNDTITIKDTYDEELIWSAIESHFYQSDKPLPEKMRDIIGSAIDQLKEQSMARLVLPNNNRSQNICMTDAIVKVLKDQRNEYANSLQAVTQQDLMSLRPGSYNEVLRIAYNFASDATTFLRLVISICDLKPIVLWGTISEHYDLSKVFQELPWISSRKKPSLKNYVSVIGDTRNSAFHNLFPFRKSLEVVLPTSALQNARLHIFSEYERKKENQLKFQDKELVDVLFEFTRARERRVPLRFWQQNLRVMERTIALFEKTGEVLRALYKY